MRAAPDPHCCRSMPKKMQTKSHVWRSRLVSSGTLNCNEHMNANGIRAIYEFHMFSQRFSTTHCASQSQRCNTNAESTKCIRREKRNRTRRMPKKEAHSARCTHILRILYSCSYIYWVCRNNKLKTIIYYFNGIKCASFDVVFFFSAAAIAATTIVCISLVQQVLYK